MERSLLIDLIRYTKNNLDSIKKFAQLSRGKFSDKEFGEFFYRMVTKDIEKNDLILNSFLNYIKATTPIRKRGTVNTLIEEVLKKYQVRLEAEKIKIFRNFGKDLPEALIPDEQLRFILDSILQYAMASMPPNGNIEFLTKSLALHKESSEEPVIEQGRKYVEVLVAFTSYKEPAEKSMGELGTSTSQKEFASDFILRLVDATIKMNQGITRFEVDDTKAKKSISLKFPVERRKVVFYEPINTNSPLNKHNIY
jgi:hypothetical protein